MAEPITHLEKTIAGEVTPVTHLEHVIAEYGGGNVYENLEAGTNIFIEETADGKAKISASGEVSSEDTVARAEIAAIKDGETLDSFGDVETALIGKADTTDIPTVPITAIQKNGTGITPVSGTVNITVPTQASDINAATATQGGKADTAIQGIKVNSSTVNPDANKVVNITVPTSATDVSALPDTTKYAAALSLTINSSTYVMTGQLKDQNGDNLGTAQTIDLPLESVVVGGSYNSQTKKVVLTLQNGNTIEFSVADLVSGLQTELSASNKLNPAYINYDSTHAAVSDTEKSTWNGKQSALTTEQLTAVNSGITSADVAQITTNKNNISLLGGGGRNVFKYTNLSGSNDEVSYVTNSDGSITVTVASTTAANRELALTEPIENTFDTMKISGSPAIATGDVEYLITGLKADGTYQNEQFSYNAVVTTINRGTPKIKFSIYVKKGTAAGTYTFYPMIQSADNQTAFSTFTPYIPTLGDIAEMIANP